MLSGIIYNLMLKFHKKNNAALLNSLLTIQRKIPPQGEYNRSLCKRNRAPKYLDKHSYLIMTLRKMCLCCC